VIVFNYSLPEVAFSEPNGLISHSDFSFREPLHAYCSQTTDTSDVMIPFQPAFAVWDLGRRRSITLNILLLRTPRAVQAARERFAGSLVLH
jgi:hypothetical protein